MSPVSTGYHIQDFERASSIITSANKTKHNNYTNNLQLNIKME